MGVMPPGVAPPGVAPAGVAPPGVAPPGVALGVSSQRDLRLEADPAKNLCVSIKNTKRFVYAYSRL